MPMANKILPEQLQPDPPPDPDIDTEGLVSPHQETQSVRVGAFRMPSPEEFKIFGTPELRSEEGQSLWEVFTATRTKWFPFELYRIGELVFYEIKIQDLREQMYAAGGDIWFNDENEPVESPYFGPLDKMWTRRDKLIKELGFTRSMMVREHRYVSKERRGDGGLEEGAADNYEADLIPR